MSLYCSYCDTVYAEDPPPPGYMCPVHLTPLEAAPAAAPAAEQPVAAAEPDPAVPPPAQPAEAPSAAGACGRSWMSTTCWRCGTAAVSSANSECLSCRRRLVPPRLVLTVRDRDIELDAGESAELGREGSHAAVFRPFPNVSRRHAKLGVDLDGSAWIEPYVTPNGTFRGPVELDPKVRYPLSSEDRLRFALHAEATVVLYALPDS